MIEQVLSTAECSICLETLQPPIRMLPCGHNFCETCLNELPISAQKQLRCPNCRSMIRVEEGGVSSFGRNRDLENIIESIKKIEITDKREEMPDVQAATQSGEELTQLRETATKLIINGKYEKALLNLEVITSSETCTEKTISLIDKAIFQIEIGQLDEASVTSTELVSLIEVNMTDDIDFIKDLIFDKLNMMSRKLVKLYQVDTVLLLINCLISLIESFYEDKAQLIKFVNIGKLIQTLSTELTRRHKQEQIKQFYSLLDRIFEQMSMTGKVDLQFKSKNIVWLLKCYGNCCNQAQDYSRSETIHKHAVSLMELAFGVDAKRHFVLGYCFNNLGACYEKSKRFAEAKTFYEKALNVFYDATDFEDENQKQQSVLVSLTNMQRVALAA